MYYYPGMSGASMTIWMIAVTLFWIAVSALIVLAVMGMGLFMAIAALEIAVMPWRSGAGHDDIAKTM